MGKDNKIILGIDPGTVVMGYGLIQIHGKEASMITMGIIQLHKFSDHYQRLGMIYQRVDGIIKEYCPDEVAVEAPFYGKNVQSMLKLGRAQGAALAPAINAGLPVYEYAPRKIKQAITGNGNASKEQVAHMIFNILKVAEKPTHLDATDGIAAALCHFYQMQNPLIEKGYKNWKEFIKKNPDRIS